MVVLRLLKGWRLARVEDDERAIAIPVEWFNWHREARVIRHRERVSAVEKSFAKLDVPLNKVAGVGRGIPMLTFDEC